MEYSKEEIEKEQEFYRSLIFGSLFWVAKLFVAFLPFAFAMADLGQFYDNMAFVFGDADKPFMFSTDLFAPCKDSVVFHSIIQVTSAGAGLAAVAFIFLAKNPSGLWKIALLAYFVCLGVAGFSRGELYWMFDISDFISLLCQ